MKKAVIIGSGAGGATAAKELQGSFDVTLLEAGGPFHPFSQPLPFMESCKKTGLFLDEREIQLIFPNMRIRKTGSKTGGKTGSKTGGKTGDRIVMVNGIGHGGTTPLSAGNALRMDEDLRRLGFDLDDAFDEINREINISTDHQKNWRQSTRQLFDICQDMDLDPQPTPKMGDYQRCSHCGQCVLGCRSGVKWDSRQYLQIAVDRGARLVSGCTADHIVIEQGKATGVMARHGLRNVFFPADLVVSAAGGFGTPAILERSGITCDRTLFVDPVLCVAAEWKDCGQNREISMPFVMQREHAILSPYFDHLSFFFNKNWHIPAKDTLSLMIKLKDETIGHVETDRRGTIRKNLTGKDKERLQESVALCQHIMRRAGIEPKNTFLGTINAGHPGGMLPLSRQEAATYHSSRLPANVYVADATLLPASLGNPPILTIIALAKKISRLCRDLK